VAAGFTAGLGAGKGDLVAGFAGLFAAGFPAADLEAAGLDAAGEGFFEAMV
jgi:hypothetical protein